MQSQYLFLGIFFLVTLALPVIGLVLAWLLRPKKPNSDQELYLRMWDGDHRGYMGAVQGPVLPVCVHFRGFRCGGRFLFPWAVAYNKLRSLRPSGDGHLHRRSCSADYSMPGGKVLWSGGERAA